MPDDTTSRGSDADGVDLDADSTTEGPAETDSGDESRDSAGVSTDRDPEGSDVVVPLRLYKTVTVFSTLIAVVSILAGFVLLDRGTQRATASPDEVSLPIVALALALIIGGSAVYAFSTRFRTEGMGKPKDDTDEPTDNG